MLAFTMTSSPSSPSALPSALPDTSSPSPSSLPLPAQLDTPSPASTPPGVGGVGGPPFILPHHPASPATKHALSTAAIILILLSVLAAVIIPFLIIRRHGSLWAVCPRGGRTRNVRPLARGNRNRRSHPDLEAAAAAANHPPVSPLLVVAAEDRVRQLRAEGLNELGEAPPPYKRTDDGGAEQDQDQGQDPHRFSLSLPRRPANLHLAPLPPSSSITLPSASAGAYHGEGEEGIELRTLRVPPRLRHSRQPQSHQSQPCQAQFHSLPQPQPQFPSHSRPREDDEISFLELPPPAYPMVVMGSTGTGMGLGLVIPGSDESPEQQEQGEEVDDDEIPVLELPPPLSPVWDTPDVGGGSGDQGRGQSRRLRKRACSI